MISQGSFFFAQKKRLAANHSHEVDYDVAAATRMSKLALGSCP